MTSQKDAPGIGAIEIIEEAVYLLRRAPLTVLAGYYVGTFPFLLGLLYFWADMSRNPFAQEYCARASLGLVLLFVWMKCWQSVFAGQMKILASSKAAPSWSLGRVSRLIVTQTILHVLALIVLPLSLILAVPFGWVYAFSQNVTVQGDSSPQRVNAVFSRSWGQALLWPGQNHVLLAVFSLFGLFLFVNVALGFLFLPQLLKSLLGIETVFTMSPWSVFNTTFLATVCILTYACMDPLVKTVYTLRCFYGESLKTGDDLKALIKPTVSDAPVKAVITIVIIVAGFLFAAAAHASSLPGASGQGREKLMISPEALERSIKRVMDRKEFAWRLPREKSEEETKELPGPIASLLKWIGSGIKGGVKMVKEWIEKLLDWLRKMLPEKQPKEPSEMEWVSSIRTLLIVLLGVLGCVLGYLFWHTWISKRERPLEVVREAVEGTPDLRDEHTKADELPSHRWLELARELMEQGSLRLAMRALYFATLVHLADNNRITIAHHKSNRDYEGELKRRFHDNNELLTVFSKSVRLIERVWYGMHEVRPEVVNRFFEDQQRIMTLGET